MILKDKILFDDLGDVLIHEMYQLIDELEGEINDESYEVMSQKMKYQKKENVPTTSKRKKRTNYCCCK